MTTIRRPEGSAEPIPVSAWPAWLARVEQLLARAGVASDDLPDYPWRDAWAAGYPPATAARMGLAAAADY